MESVFHISASGIIVSAFYNLILPGILAWAIILFVSRDPAFGILQSRKRWRNWSGGKEAQPTHVHFVESVAEVTALLKRANSNQHKVKVVGGSHSWSGVAVADSPNGNTETHVLSLDKMNRVLRVDKSQRLVTVEAGIRLKDLNKELERIGLAMSNLGSISEQSIAGAICTGTHGTGLSHQILASQVMQFTLVTPEAKIIVATTNQPQQQHVPSTEELITLMELSLSSNENNSVGYSLLTEEQIREYTGLSSIDFFNAALISFGSLGVVVNMTLQCVDAFRLREIEEPVLGIQMPINSNTSSKEAQQRPTFEQFFESKAHAPYHHAKLWWLPHANVATLISHTRIDSAANKMITGASSSSNSRGEVVKDTPAFLFWLEKYFIFQYILSPIVFLSSFSCFRRCIPSALRLASPLFALRKEKVAVSYKAFNLGYVPIHEECEYALPLKYALNAMRDIHQWIESPNSNIFINDIVEIRFVKGDGFWLSPANRHFIRYTTASATEEAQVEEVDEWCFVSFLITCRDKSELNRFFTGIESIFNGKYGARSHWGKVNTLKHTHCHRLYKRFGDFTALRNACDPNNVLVNRQLATIFNIVE